MQIPFIDLFCGAGGLSAGFEMAGFSSVFANDYDSYACKTYQENHPQSKMHVGDVKDVNAKVIASCTETGSIPLVIGGPNCQGVSLRGKRDPNDPKNQMFYHFVRLLKEVRPTWFVMENVPGLLHRQNRELLRDIFSEFSSLGYKCGGEVLSAVDYGVPQLRYRFLVIGNLLDQEIYFPNPTHEMPEFIDGEHVFYNKRLKKWNTAYDAIGDLKSVENGGGEEFTPYKKVSVITEFQRYCRGNNIGVYNHICHKTPPHNIELIKHIPPGGNWKCIPEHLRPARFQRVALKDHTTTFGRLRWEMSSRTITTYFNNISSGAFTHPEQDRGITVREGARFQSFPDNFRFFGPLARQYRQVGNAVPPLMVKIVAETVKRQMAGQNLIDQEVHRASVEYDKASDEIVINRPLQGMRFNLDKYLVRRAL